MRIIFLNRSEFICWNNGSVPFFHLAYRRSRTRCCNGWRDSRFFQQFLSCFNPCLFYLQWRAHATAEHSVRVPTDYYPQDAIKRRINCVLRRTQFMSYLSASWAVLMLLTNENGGLLWTAACHTSRNSESQNQILK